ncbi:hypothetical protein [Helicobacter kayseriensis]|uniref:hypothetical protein n=1 Tax=Helicobacter kayseriensis TaxID=2905877 RepID=UPI001E44800B|nr:hypothetical protein [Helicobacter kayseriensis]MCE3047594.1 hypothetical protein [Helicobacter kayseriensis]MCE3048965.1 hypothetical protein [Helicobacter kayseriensis]
MNTQQTLSQNEKDALTSISSDSGKINGKDLVWALIIFLLIFCVFAPKIYVSGQIYYISRDIAKIDSHLELLQEENKNLRQELEDFKFQQILRMDPLQ